MQQSYRTSWKIYSWKSLSWVGYVVYPTSICFWKKKKVSVQEKWVKAFLVLSICYGPESMDHFYVVFFCTMLYFLMESGLFCFYFIKWTNRPYLRGKKNKNLPSFIKNESHYSKIELNNLNIFWKFSLCAMWWTVKV